MNFAKAFRERNYDVLVPIAAKTLDKMKPGWWKLRRFSLARLDLMRCDDCVLGQVFAEEAKQSNAYEVHNGYGFAYRKRGLVRFFGSGTFAAENAEKVWKKLIQKRRKAAA